MLAGRQEVLAVTPRRGLLGFFAAMIVVHGVLAWWQPLQGEDWDQLTWTAEHTESWLATHFTLPDIVSFALARSVGGAILVTVLASTALVLGVFVVARRRLPRATWDDVLGVVMVSALIWIGLPRAGFVWFHRAHVAYQIVGCAIAAWFIAPFRCGWRVRGVGAALLAIAGLCVGTSTRQIAVATLVGVGWAVVRMPRRDRAGWMWLALAGLAVGTVIGFLDPPYIALNRVYGRNLEVTLVALNLPIRETGQIIALLLLLALAKLAIDAWWPAQRPPTNAPPLPARETLAWLGGWLAICVACLCGPRYSEATLLPATLVLVIAALPYVAWLCETRVVRGALGALAVGLHVVVWSTGLVVLHQLSGEFQDRMARLAATPPGGTAVISPYSQNAPNNWFYGEDWGPSSRQLIGIELFGVADIAFDASFGALEDSAGLVFHLEVEGLADEVRRATSPALWSNEVAGARTQFETFVVRAERAAGPTFRARLLVDNLAFAAREARPLELASYADGALFSPHARRSNFDVHDRLRISPEPTLPAIYPEAYVVHDGRGEGVLYNAGAYGVQPMEVGLFAVVACNPQRCLLVDAFVSRL